MIRSPRTPLRRLVSLVAATTVTVLALAGCSTGTATTSPTDGASGSAASDSFPVTIPNAFGDTTIDAKPERVVTWGWGSADAALAMGVVPVAIPFQSYGGDENGVLPWIQDQLTTLGADTPTVLPDSTDEPPYEAIQKADPDVILAPYSGITKEQYDLLSQIAPTVAYPETAWSTPWRDVITIVGKALGESAKAQGVLDGIDAQLKTEADAHPEFAGKSIAAVWDTAGTFYVYKKEDPRVETLLDLGFTSARSVDDLANGDQTFYYTLSYENTDQLSSDVVLAYADTQADADAFLKAPQDAALPAVADGHVAQLVGTQYIAAVSPPTALSLPWGLDALVSALASATE